MRLESDILYIQIWQNYGNIYFRKSNSSADLYEEAFCTYLSSIFNSTRVNNYQTHVRHFTYVETKTAEKEFISSSPLYLKEEPTEFLRALHSQQYNCMSS